MTYLIIVVLSTFIWKKKYVKFISGKMNITKTININLC